MSIGKLALSECLSQLRRDLAREAERQLTRDPRRHLPDQWLIQQLAYVHLALMAVQAMQDEESGDGG